MYNTFVPWLLLVSSGEEMHTLESSAGSSVTFHLVIFFTIYKINMQWNYIFWLSTPPLLMTLNSALLLIVDCELPETMKSFITPYLHSRLIKRQMNLQRGIVDTFVARPGTMKWKGSVKRDHNALFTYEHLLHSRRRYQDSSTPYQKYFISRHVFESSSSKSRYCHDDPD